MSLVVLAMTIIIIIIEDRWPVATVLLFAGIIIVPAALVDTFVLLGPEAGGSDDPLARPRERRGSGRRTRMSRRGRRRDE